MAAARKMAGKTRAGCTGSASGPSLYHLLEILGRERVLERFDRALRKFGS